MTHRLRIKQNLRHIKLVLCHIELVEMHAQSFGQGQLDIIQQKHIPYDYVRDVLFINYFKYPPLLKTSAQTW